MDDQSGDRIMGSQGSPTHVHADQTLALSGTIPMKTQCPKQIAQKVNTGHNRKAPEQPGHHRLPHPNPNPEPKAVDPASKQCRP